MTTKTKSTATTNKPKYYAYHITEAKDGGKARWNRIGAYFTHKDDGGTLVIDLLPVAFNGRIVLRAPKASS